MPSAYIQWPTSADFGLGSSFEVVIVGEGGAADTRRMIEALQTGFIPNHVAVFRPSDEDTPEIDGLAEFVRDHCSVDGRATAYVCRENACQTPVTDVKDMLESLK